VKVGISDDIDATLEALNNLHAGELARKAETFGKLQAIVANLDAVIPPMQDDYEAAELRPRRRDDPRSAPPQTGDGFGEVPIQDGRPGHEFSGKLRAKLVAEALDKGHW
jgi:hypothetical protein